MNDLIWNPERMGKLSPHEFQIVPKGWGWERWLWNNEDYCCKELFFFKGKFCSWHYHIEKDELFRVLTGKLYVEYSTEDCLLVNEDGNKILDVNKTSWSVLETGDVFHVPRGLRHRMCGSTDCLLLEISTTHKDEDSIRLVKGD